MADAITRYVREALSDPQQAFGTLRMGRDGRRPPPHWGAAAHELRRLREEILEVSPADFEARIREHRLEELPDTARAVNGLRDLLMVRDEYRALIADEAVPDEVRDSIEAGLYTGPGERRHRRVALLDEPLARPEAKKLARGCRYTLRTYSGLLGRDRRFLTTLRALCGRKGRKIH